MLETVDSPIVRKAPDEPIEQAVSDVEVNTDDHAPGGASLATVLRNRWHIVLCVWLLVCGLGLALVWTRFQTEYRAEGIVRLAPYIPRLVFATENNAAAPFYGAFLTTQMQLITNDAVLNRALEAPGIKSLPCFAGLTDPAEYLSKSLKIENPSNTELISISYAGPDPSILAPVVNAVLKAYMEQVIEQDQSSDTQKIELLYKKQADLENELKVRNEELYTLANEYGTLSLNSLQDTVLAGVREIEVEMKRTQAIRVTAQARLDALKAQGPAPVSSLDMVEIKNEMLIRDPELSALSMNRRVEENRLLQANQQLGPGHRENRYARERVAQFDKLIAEREQALGGSVTTLADYRAKLIYEADTKKAEQELAEAVQREKALKEILDGDLARATVTGRNAVQLQAVRDRVDQSKQLHRTVLDRIQSLEVEKQRPARVTVASWATDPTSPAKDKRPKLSVLVVAAGLFLSLMLAVIVDSRDTSVRCEEDIRRSVGLNLLGTRSMPRRRSAGNQAVLAAIAEEIRWIRGCILFAGEATDLRSVLITSPNSQEGKTRMTGDLAVALAESGRRVLAIDADNYKRDLSRRFGVEDRPGLSEYMSNGHEAADFICATDTPGLWLIPSGSPNDQFSELLVRPGRIENLCKAFPDFDLVLVDSPPVMVSNEPGIWARHLDAALMILRSRHSSREDAIAAKAKISQMGGHIIGAVLNGVQPRGRYYQRYGYYQRV